MSTLIVFQQMLVIFLLIAIGYFASKKGWINENGSRTMSFLVVNITNPAVAISSAFTDDLSVTREEVMLSILVVLILYAVMIIFGKITAHFIGVEKSERKFYEMMSVYTNVGFVGIPVVSAVLGPQAVLYNIGFIVLFNILFYTHGFAVMRPDEEGTRRISWKTFVNVGTVSGVIAILVFWFRLRFPMVIESTISYAGRATTFMAMIVLGVSLAKIPLKSLFEGKQMYLFWALRYLALPLLTGFVLRQIFGSNLMTMTLTLLMAMPAANLPLMLANQLGMNTDTLSRGTFITTVLSILTVTLTSMVM